MALIPIDVFAQSIDTAVKDSPFSPLNSRQYIVTYKDSVSDPAQMADEISRRHRITYTNTYSRALKGFVAKMDKVQFQEVQNDPQVASVVEDKELHTLYQEIPTGIQRIGVPIGSRRLLSSRSTIGGAGVVIATLDTGAQLNHPDLSANIMSGTSCVSGARTANDDNGHGTHVAGIIAALNNTRGVVGVAPSAKIVPVKVLDKNGSGTWSSVICGIDWITAHAQKLGIKIVNMSMGGAGTSDNNCGATNNDPLHAAICKSRDAGLTYVVAAGNDVGNVDHMVPAAYDDAVITVSGIADSDGAAGGKGRATSYGADDTFASFSNYGSGVDIAAPSVNILSTWLKGVYRVLSGTSMAAPHVAGVAARYIEAHPNSTWTQIRDALKAAGETLGRGHTDPSGLHGEPVVRVST